MTCPRLIMGDVYGGPAEDDIPEEETREDPQEAPYPKNLQPRRPIFEAVYAAPPVSPKLNIFATSVVYAPPEFLMETAPVGWDCPSCGHWGIPPEYSTCPNCGSKKPEPDSDAWDCPGCGGKKLPGAYKFCPECGTKKPEPKSDTWICPLCGEDKIPGTFRFCYACGAKNPQPAPSWNCPFCGEKEIPLYRKFCPRCGRKGE